MRPSPHELYIGLMSGTSMDGIDAALIDCAQIGETGAAPKLISTYSQPWPDAIQQALINARHIPDDQLDSLDSLDLQTANIFAQACTNVLEASAYKAQDVIAIGNHGQTIRHRPDIEQPFSLQIGNAERIAAVTGINVISDFRTADIKVGGQGAPLTPAFHYSAFQHPNINRVIVNIGGIANITMLPKDKNAENSYHKVTGFDCGPGNTLMDAWTSKQQHKAYDVDGEFAASGKTNATLLAMLLMDDYFQLAPPKSTGFEHFNLQWLEQYLKKGMDSADIQSTLCDLTATSIIRAINQYSQPAEEIFICGGGVHNQQLMRRLRALTQCPVATTETLGIHPDWVEAVSFAWLAYRHNHQQTGNLPSVTGAEKAVILGKKTLAR